MGTNRSFRAVSIALASVVIAGSTALATELSAKSPNNVVKSTWSPAPIPSIYDPAAGPNASRRTDFITDVCSTDAQLDCVEGIGAFINGAWVNGTSTSTLHGSGRVWQVPGLVNPDGTDRVAVAHFINYSGNLFLKTLIMAMGNGGDEDSNGIQRDVKLKATIRTSWVLPTHISTKMLQVQTKVEKLSVSGASRITVEGLPMVHPIVNDQTTLTDPAGKAAKDARSFSMTVSDGRFYPIKKSCIELPTLVTNDNGYGHQIPTLNGAQFDVKIPAPHFRSDGVTEHVGHFSSFIPLETARCLWDLSVLQNAQVAASVIGASGETKNATASAAITSEGVSLNADGFLFSSPTVRLEVKVPKPKTPSRVRITTARRTLTIKLPVLANQSYKVTATKNSTKNVLCKTSGSTTTCSVKSLSAGTWRIKVVALNISGTSPAWTKTVRIR